ncbi:MAG: gamma-glutamyltransferase [Acidobacteriota bacterium]
MSRLRASPSAARMLAGFLGAAAMLIACGPSRLGRQLPPADRHVPFNFLGRRAMVVAAHPLAVEAGLKLLRSGGNAVDAAVAVALALNAAEPFASGIGGGGFMLIYLANQNRVAVINFREKAPQAAHAGMFRERGGDETEWRTASGLAVAVPGALSGYDLALRRYGTRTLADAAVSAIAIAEQGFEVSATFSSVNTDEYEKLLKNAGEGSCYLKEGLPYDPGEHIRNPDLARTLRLVASKGVAEFYQGEIARKIVAAVRAKQGVMTLADLAAYRAAETAPLVGRYREFTIFTAPPPASGGLHLLQFLNIVERWPLKAWGLNTAAYVHHLSEALRFIFADKERYLGDPEFVSIPIVDLVSKDYAARVASRILEGNPFSSYSPGDFKRRKDDAANTTHLCVIDEQGNAVALTQSINDFFGTGIVPEGTGFLLNDQMDDFASDVQSTNAPGPGRRPVSSMGPVLMFSRGKPFLILGSPGGTRIFSSLTQIILNVTAFGMSLDEAIEAPRFFTSSAQGKPMPIDIESRFPDAVAETLRKMGHVVEVRGAYDKYFGGAQGLMVLPKKNIILGGADSRRDGFGAGY